MKVVKKIIMVLFIISCMTLVFNATAPIVQAGDVTGQMSAVGKGTPTTGTGLSDVIKKVLGLLRTLTGLLAIIVIAYTGFTFVTETPEGKAKVKDKMLPIVIGVALTFMATTIAVFIVGLFEK